MSSSRKESLQTLAEDEAAEAGSERAVYLRDGRTLTIGEQGTDQVVEIRSGAGMLELRIRLTEEGPVLQMEAVRMQLKASEAVEIESQKVTIKGSEQLALEGGEVGLKADEDVKVEANGDVRVVGTKIHLN